MAENIVIADDKVLSAKIKQEIKQDIKQDIKQEIKQDEMFNETSAKSSDTKKAELQKSSNGKKKKKKLSMSSKDILKCIVVLSLIALIGGVLLGVINWLTYVDPDMKIMGKVAKFHDIPLESISKNVDRVVNQDGSKSLIKEVYEAKGEDGKTLGFAYYAVGAGAKAGTMQLLVYVAPNGVIKEISVYSQTETAGYFAKVEKANKPKYIGVDINKIDAFDLLGSKGNPVDESDINAVSQATFTSRGYNNAINAVVYAFKNFKEVA
ncbi:MAG: FMN-binding protein [Clostridia bacterium]